MDNQNNPNPPNTPPSPSSPFGVPTPPPTTPVWPPVPQDPTPTWTPPQTTPDVSSSAWPTPQPTVSSWTPPVQSASQPEPVSPTTTPSLSPLDNPWGSPAQPPTIDGSSTIASTQQPSWMGVNANPTATQTPISPSLPAESAPTDLSHLISNTDSQSNNQTAPEPLIVPTVAAPIQDVPTTSNQDHKGIPKWLIGLGAGLLLLVLVASAYFILGIGQPSKETTSLPATTASQTSELKPPAPIVTPAPAKPIEKPAASGSTNFGELGGSANASPTATSAADLLR